MAAVRKNREVIRPRLCYSATSLRIAARVYRITRKVRAKNPRVFAHCRAHRTLVTSLTLTLTRGRYRARRVIRESLTLVASLASAFRDIAADLTDYVGHVESSRPAIRGERAAFGEKR